jgi:hypothetical protein
MAADMHPRDPARFRHGFGIAVALVAVAAAGVVVGLWTGSLTDLSPCPGLCAIFLVPRFAPWQSVLLGVGASAVVVAAEVALYSQLRRALLRWLHWLTKDLTSEAR